ncbi:MAG: hypothetical protein FD133_1035 [Erysipelotrichaceae bacterium]|nr:MAG: hypothetical protein FD179_84 [Erysipelotrichaceae bacterium]TXT18199.1 MAG: hypothetical protein FD133_1035 [Erysipelotrichaceae bacterium]
MNSKLTHYKNGQVIHITENAIMTYFYKDGSLKAKGPVNNQIMEGEWFFYRENGQISQIGHFKNGLKHGSWIRYDKEMNIEYDETFVEHKIVKKKL